MFRSPLRLSLAVIPRAGASVADEELGGLCQRAACGLSLEPQLAAMGALLADACPGLPQAQVCQVEIRLNHILVDAKISRGKEGGHNVLVGLSTWLLQQGSWVC